jgi:hypothetical protein
VTGFDEAVIVGRVVLGDQPEYFLLDLRLPGAFLLGLDHLQGDHDLLLMVKRLKHPSKRPRPNHPHQLIPVPHMVAHPPPKPALPIIPHPPPLPLTLLPQIPDLGNPPNLSPLLLCQQMRVSLAGLGAGQGVFGPLVVAGVGEEAGGVGGVGGGGGRVAGRGSLALGGVAGGWVQVGRGLFVVV